MFSGFFFEARLSTGKEEFYVRAFELQYYNLSKCKPSIKATLFEFLIHHFEKAAEQVEEHFHTSLE
jgi:hypothetical protein